MPRNSESFSKQKEENVEPEKENYFTSRREIIKKAAAIGAGVVLSSGVLARQEKSREERENKEIPESEQLDVIVLPLTSQRFDLTEYFLDMPENIKESEEKYYKNPVTRAVYESYKESERNGLRNKGVYRVGLGNVKTGQISLKLDIKEKNKEGAFYFFPHTGGESERLDLLGDTVLEKTFGLENKNQNKRIILIVSSRCNPPPLGKEGGQWNEIPLVDVILVPVRNNEQVEYLHPDSPELEKWKDFIKKKKGRIIQPLFKDGKIMNKENTGKSIYFYLSQFLKPRG